MGQRTILDRITGLRKKLVTVCWRGPYSYQEIDDQSGYGLYLFTGKCKYQRVARVQYCGITEQLYLKRFQSHHIIDDIERDLQIWLGQIIVPRRPARSTLLHAEWAVIYTLQPPLNTQCRWRPPEAITILSTWRKSRHPLIADVPTVFPRRITV